MAIIPGGLVGPTPGQIQQQSGQAMAQGFGQGMQTGANMARQRQMKRVEDFSSNMQVIQGLRAQGISWEMIIKDRPDLMKSALRNSGLSRRNTEQVYQQLLDAPVSQYGVIAELMADALSEHAAQEVNPQPQPEEALREQFGISFEYGDDEDDSPPEPVSGGGPIDPRTTFSQPEPGRELSGVPRSFGPPMPVASMQGDPTVQRQAPAVGEQRVGTRMAAERARPDGPPRTSSGVTRSFIGPDAITGAAPVPEPERVIAGEPDAITRAGEQARQEHEAEPVPVSPQEQSGTRLFVPEPLKALAPDLEQIDWSRPPGMGKEEYDAKIGSENWAKFNAAMPPTRDASWEQAAIDQGFVDGEGQPNRQQYEAQRQQIIHNLQHGQPMDYLPPEGTRAHLSWWSGQMRQEVQRPEVQQQVHSEVAEASAALSDPAVLASFGAANRNISERMARAASSVSEATQAGDAAQANQSAREFVNLFNKGYNTDELRAQIGADRQNAQENYLRAMNNPDFLQGLAITMQDPMVNQQASAAFERRAEAQLMEDPWYRHMKEMELQLEQQGHQVRIAELNGRLAIADSDLAIAQMRELRERYSFELAQQFPPHMMDMLKLGVNAMVDENMDPSTKLAFAQTVADMLNTSMGGEFYTAEEIRNEPFFLFRLFSESRLEGGRVAPVGGSSAPRGGPLSPDAQALIDEAQ